MKLNERQIRHILESSKIDLDQLIVDSKAVKEDTETLKLEREVIKDEINLKRVELEGKKSGWENLSDKQKIEYLYQLISILLKNELG